MSGCNPVHPGRDLASISTALAANDGYFEALRERRRADAATMLQAAARRCAACGEVAQRRATSTGKAVPLYEISPCGHCPHHEAPNCVNQLLSKSSELKVLIATQVPLGVKAEAPEGFGFHTAGDVDLVFTPVTVERMRPKVS